MCDLFKVSGYVVHRRVALDLGNEGLPFPYCEKNPFSIQASHLEKGWLSYSLSAKGLLASSIGEPFCEPGGGLCLCGT